MGEIRRFPQDYPWIQHHGAVTGVTGSCHQLWLTPDNSVLIDCGLFQGAEVSAAGAGSGDLSIEFAMQSVRALIATHVHIDHIGRLPWLLAAGFQGPVHCSQASALLMPTVLEDAFMVGVQRDRELAGRFVGLVRQRLQGHAYGEWVTVLENAAVCCRIRLQRAGHILGSAWVDCDVRYPETERRRRLVFSGDLGATHAPLLPPPVIPEQADVVVLESTYGDRQHENRRQRQARLQAVLEHALTDGGTVLIPAFSIGRTQELLYELEDIISQQRGYYDWARLPVILDSPLASRFTDLYRELQPYWDKEALERVAAGRRPLAFDNLLRVDDHAQHQAMVNRLAQTRQPAVVIAGSGMCTAGRIVNYLKAMLGDARHDVVFVGYQAEGTPGRQIQRYGPRGGYVELDNERYDIRAQVHVLGGYSAHADRDGLVGFVTGMEHWPEQVRLVHGDPQAKQALAEQLREHAKRRGKALDVVIPEA
ncbi:MBL fold metallo-hydrolase RNA specificity domain-containing protein [Halopseudomonas salegens]|uniref:Metallo-beta-lactamase family protein n=1 Tax=Halopseudomonas salegens TaxID=1434072 RepID=A0A1H2FKL3_9GAMM|nr:MBL fold metallo-hydrolase [Halopseudomonas salegens]SDU07940.1 metallo-beta-lactamase family protein [Halopseudomonas salegens]